MPCRPWIIAPVMLVRTMDILARSLGRRAFAGYPNGGKVPSAANYRIVALVAMTERERAYRCDFMRQLRESRVPDMFLELSFSRGVHFPYNIIHLWRFSMATQHKGAQNHTSAAEHHEHAAHHHREAAKHHESGAHEKAGHHAHMAHGHASHARHHAEEASKHHAQEHGSKK